MLNSWLSNSRLSLILPKLYCTYSNIMLASAALEEAQYAVLVKGSISYHIIRI